jgi:diketogulonate reductase-like aldo/keto reductase
MSTTKTNHLIKDTTSNYFSHTTITMVHLVSLSDGNKMPSIGFGSSSFKMIPELGITFDQPLSDSMSNAITVGLRHFDGAEGYSSSVEFAAAHKKHPEVPREELYVVTKVFPQGEGIKDPAGTLRKLLGELELE